MLWGIMWYAGKLHCLFGTLVYHLVMFVVFLFQFWNMYACAVVKLMRLIYTSIYIYMSVYI